MVFRIDTQSLKTQIQTFFPYQNQIVQHTTHQFDKPHQGIQHTTHKFNKTTSQLTIKMINSTKH